MGRSETPGERLQRLRQAAGLSQSQLAKAARVPVGTLRNWEQDRRVPLLDTAARIARAIGITLDELAGDAEAADLAPKGLPSTGPGAGREEKRSPRKARK